MLPNTTPICSRLSPILGAFVAFRQGPPVLDFPAHFIFQRPSTTFSTPLWMCLISISLQTFFSPKSRCRSIGLVDFIQSALVTLSRVAATRYTTSWAGVVFPPSGLQRTKSMPLQDANRILYLADKLKARTMGFDQNHHGRELETICRAA
jgi:hypothetical protein